jgi:hypothetical protein
MAPSRYPEYSFRPRATRSSFATPSGLSSSRPARVHWAFPPRIAIRVNIVQRAATGPSSMPKMRGVTEARAVPGRGLEDERIEDHSTIFPEGLQRSPLPYSLSRRTRI